MEELTEGSNTVNQSELEQTQRRMDELLFREEMMWLQRS
jgi:hypothetical protein